jgi:hypothetical protein
MLALGACSKTTVVRLQPDAVHVGKGLRPVAGIQANATSAYVLFFPIPGKVDLDHVVNQMLVVKAKTLGADKVQILSFDVTPNGGIWTLRKLAGWRSAKATGIAVQVTGLPPDPDADQGPEPAPPGATPPSQPTPQPAGGNATGGGGKPDAPR